jgi:hypothetical protein
MFDNAYMVPTVTTGGPSPAAVTIYNSSGQQYTVGLSQLVKGSYAALCAFPLNGGDFSLALTPVETVLLMWAGRTINAGTIIETGYSSGLLIDMTGAPPVGGVLTRDVVYDTGTGWNLNNEYWTTQVAINTELASVLITSPTQTAYSHSRQLALAQARWQRRGSGSLTEKVTGVKWKKDTFIIEENNTFLSGTITVQTVVAVGFVTFALVVALGVVFSVQSIGSDGTTIGFVYNGTRSAENIMNLLTVGAQVVFHRPTVSSEV